MRVKDLIIESEQLNELTGKDIGRGVQKVAKGIGAIGGGIAGIPSAMKKGFTAGKTAVGGKPVAKPAATTPAAASTNPTDTAAPAKKPGVLSNIKQAASAFKQGFQQGAGQEEPADEPAATTAPAAKTKTAAAPAAEPAAATPGNDVKAIAQMQKDFAAQMQDLSKFKEDTMTNLSMLLRRISALEKAANTTPQQ